MVRLDFLGIVVEDIADLSEEEAETLSLFLSGQTFYCHRFLTDELVGWQIDIEPHEEASIDEEA